MRQNRHGRRLSPGKGLSVLPIVALLAGLFSTAVAWRLVHYWVEVENTAQSEKQAESVHGNLVQLLALYDHSLHAAAGFVSLSDTVSIRDWAGFIDNMGITTTLRGIPALAYAPVVKGEDAEAFVRAVREDGLPDFHLWPSADAPVLVPNRFSAPMNEPNLRALGFDMYQNPLRRSALEAARDSGSTAVTARVTLTIDGGARAEPAVIAYTPVYAKDMPLATVEDRRKAIRGFALAPIRIPTLLSQVLENLDVQAVIRVQEDGGGEQGGVLYAMPGGDSVEQWWQRQISFSNRNWTVSYGIPARAGGSVQAYLPAATLVVGGILTMLLTMVLRNVVMLHANAVLIASDMTRALRDSEAKFKAIFDNSVQYQSLLAPDGSLISANPAALGLVGGELESIAGEKFWDIAWIDREDERSRVREALRCAVDGEKSNLNVMRGHKGGEMLVAMSFQPVRGSDGEVAWIVAEGRDLTEWRRREDALGRAVEALTHSNQELERFAHIAAHDLQEPCRTIVSYAQLLERRCAGQLDDEGAEFLRYLVAGAHRMRDLVSDLLAYSHVKGRSEPFAEVDCAQLLRSVLDDMASAIMVSGASIQVNDLPAVWGDGGQLAQLFQNLIGNALKFRRRGVVPQVTVAAERQGGDWLFSVADNGIGIAKEYHHRVFEIFQRLHGADRFPGTGIGLAICRKVVERHGGRIWVDSEEGAGATFRFTIPAAG